MSVEGFNRQHRRVRSNSDFIVIHFDPEKTQLQDVVSLMESINNIPERNRGTVFTLEPEGMWFRRI